MFDLMNQLARQIESHVGVFPALNLWEDADRYVLEAELPGIKADGVEVSVVDDVLTLQGTRPAAAPEAGGFLRRERAAGAFARSIQLPAGVDASQVEATLRDGVLTVVLPKAETAKPRRIPVKVS